MKKRNRRKVKKLTIKEKKPSRFALPEETKKRIWGILMFLGAVIIALSFFEKAGIAGQILMKTFYFLIGKTVFLIPLILAIGGLIFFRAKHKLSFKKFEGGPLLLAILTLVTGISGILGSRNLTQKQGGWLGYIFSWPLLKSFGFWVTQIIFGAVLIIGGLIFWYLLRTPSFLKEEKKFEEEKKFTKEKEPLITRIFKRGEPKLKVKEIEPEIREVPVKLESPIELKPKPLSRGPKGLDYQPLSLDLLEREKERPTAGDTRMNSAVIKKTLQNFDIPVEMSEINIGPTVTQYTLKPAEGVRLSKITGLSNNLALALASHPIRIEAPIPGRSLVGIEIPNKVRARVRLRNLIENPDFQRSSNLTLVLGRDVSGLPIYTDLAKMPHLLVAGATGTGKTIFLNSLILSLLYHGPTNINPFSNGPEILRFILIDPKRVEFQTYNNLPHLLCPVIYNAQKTVNVLKWLTGEMERRFDVLAEAKTKDLAGYNEIALTNEVSPMPYIILIIDELADLMAAKGREIEAGIVRLAQMARSVGIHLVVATQRPSVEVITGLIKANITSRITFQVASQVDSRTVLDMAGAEKLLGLGDLLYISAETGKPKRIQGAYISDKEVKKVVNYIKSKVKNQELKIGEEIIENELAQDLEKELEVPEAKLEGFYSKEDPLYEKAKEIVIEAKKASSSLLQRRLQIGYARAARLIDMLEERGVVGPGEGAKPREVHGGMSPAEGEESQSSDDESEWQKI